LHFKNQVIKIPRPFHLYKGLDRCLINLFNLPYALMIKHKLQNTGTALKPTNRGIYVVFFK